MRTAGQAVVRFWHKAYQENLTGLAAMVAYNLLLSVFPLALIALFIAGQVLSSEELAESILFDLEQLFPSAAESTLDDVVRNIEGSSTTVGIVAFVTSIYVSGSFWGAMDTAFCGIYDLPCRSWVRQKLFSLVMLLVVLLFMAATVAVPTLQSLVASSARDLPLGLSDVPGLVYWLLTLGGLITLFLLLCVIYFAVPSGIIPWTCVWPGALLATIAIGIVDYAFPLYLNNVSTVGRIGTTLVFILIALLWFYVVAIVILGGAVVNQLRFEARRANGRQAEDDRGNEREPEPERGQDRSEEAGGEATAPASEAVARPEAEAERRG